MELARRAGGASFAANVDVFVAMGASLGKTVGDAFLKAMEDGVGQVRRRIAELVAPEVAAILNAARPRGSLP